MSKPTARQQSALLWVCPLLSQHLLICATSPRFEEAISEQRIKLGSSNFERDQEITHVPTTMLRNVPEPHNDLFSQLSHFLTETE